MKKQLLILLFGGFLVTTGCEKDPVRPSSTTSIQPPTPPFPVNPVNTGFIAYAGEDIWLPLPAHSSVVNGYTNLEDSEVESYTWKNLAGPDSFLIENPASKRSKISNLKEGTYVFEFTVKRKNGLINSDKISVHVYNPRIANKNEFVFQNLQWGCPWGCSLLIENFDLYISQGTPIKVYLKSGNSNWIEVYDSWDAKYVYAIDDNIFQIYSDFPDNEELPAEVKITF